MSPAPSDPTVTEVADEFEQGSRGLRLVVVAGPARGRKIPIEQGTVRIGSDPAATLCLDDRRVSREHLELSPHPAGVLVRDLGSKNGTMLGANRITEAIASPGSVISVVDHAFLIERIDDGPELPPSAHTQFGGLLGASPAMRRLFTALERVAPTDYTVLLEGETGTGKEVVARALHDHSSRRSGPFVVLDCSATNSGVLESELFGHVKGAFTGADRSREGAFRRAHRGTLFIDELSSLPLELQAKLLRALESRMVRPVGGDHEVAVDLRVIAATNVPLRQSVKRGEFREDLYFRMSVVRLELPPLRARLEDIPTLAKHFLAVGGLELEPSGPNLDKLLGYAWPGNVRELRNTIERALALAGIPEPSFAELPIWLGDLTPTMTFPLSLDAPFKEAKDHLVAAFERLYLGQLLKACEGNTSEAARRAGLSRRHLFDLLRKHKLHRDDDQS